MIDATIEAAMNRLAKMPRRMPVDDNGPSRAQIDQWVAEAGVPKRHRLTQPVGDGHWGETVESLTERLNTGFVIILAGKRGTGKTQAAVEAIKRTCESGRRALYTTLHQLERELKGTFDDRYRTEEDVIAKHRRPSLLVIDEAGKAGTSEWLQGTFFDLVDARYGSMRDTIIITNANRSQLSSVIGDSILRRARETGGALYADDWEVRG